MYKNVYKYDDMKRAEHMAVRNAVGWYLFTHEIIEVTGPDATAFLDYVCPKNIGNLGITRGRYTTLLNEKGWIIDDTVIFRMDENCYWVSTLYTKKNMPWFDQVKGDYNVEYKDITPQWDMYSVQGPKSKELMNELIEEGVDDVKFFQILDKTMDGTPVKVNKGGFTGEKNGYELYVKKEDTKKECQELKLKPNSIVFKT